MRAFRFYAILLALLLCGCAPAFAQFGFVSNLTIKGGFTPGYTTENDPGVTNGTIRWNPAVTALQVRVGAGWTNLAAGIISGMGGSYSQTPWTSNVSGAWFNLADVAYGTFSNILVHNDLTVGDHLTAGTATMGGTVINGDLTVNGTLTRVTEVTITTNVYVNTGTTYVHTVVYDTQTVYQTTVVFTNLVTTNRVDTFVNVGGSFTMGAGSTFNATGATTVIFPYFSAALSGGVTATGAWDFSGATVTGLLTAETDPTFSAVSNQWYNWIQGTLTSGGATQAVSTVGSSTVTSSWDSAARRLSWSNGVPVSIGSTSGYQNIASYTYTGGEASVTIAFEPKYNPVVVMFSGNFVADGGTNPFPGDGVRYGVRINGRVDKYKTVFVYSSYASAYPYANGTDYTVTNYLALRHVLSTNHAAYVAVGLTTCASWTFISSPQGIFSDGAGTSVSMNGQEYGLFRQMGTLFTNDYVGNNLITQMNFAAYSSSSGVQFLAKSNGTIRIMGVIQ